MSSKLSGRISRSSARIGPPSSWKTPSVSPRAEQLVGRRVVERQVLEDQRLAAVGLDVVQRVVEDREVAQPEEVHLDQAERLARRVVELGDDRAVGGRLSIGMTSISGSLDMITPAACTPHCRLRPSMPIAVSTTVLTSGSAS